MPHYHGYILIRSIIPKVPTIILEAVDFFVTPDLIKCQRYTSFFFSLQLPQMIVDYLLGHGSPQSLQGV